MASIERTLREGGGALWRGTTSPFERAVYNAIVSKIEVQVPCCEKFLNGLNLVPRLASENYLVLCSVCSKILTDMTRAELVELETEIGTGQLASKASALAGQNRVFSQGFFISSGPAYDTLFRLIAERRPNGDICCAGAYTSIKAWVSVVENEAVLSCGVCGKEAIRTNSAEVLNIMGSTPGDDQRLVTSLATTAAELIEDAVAADLLPLQRRLAESGGGLLACCPVWRQRPTEMISLRRAGRDWQVFCKNCGRMQYSYDEERLEPLVIAELKRRTGWKPRRESQELRRRFDSREPTELAYRQLLEPSGTYGGQEPVWDRLAVVQTLSSSKSDVAAVLLEDYRKYRATKRCCPDQNLVIKFEGPTASVECTACQTIGAVYSPDSIEYATAKAAQRAGSAEVRTGRMPSSPNRQSIPLTRTGPAKIVGLNAEDDRFANLELPPELIAKKP